MVLSAMRAHTITPVFCCGWLNLIAVRTAVAKKISSDNSIDDAGRIHSVPIDTKTHPQPSPVW